MKKVKKIMPYVVVTVLLLIVVAMAYVSWALPNVGKPEELKVDITPARVAHGKYLAMHVNVCIDCHSTRDWTIFAAPIDTTQQGGGGELFDASAGFPGKVYSSNITPGNLKNWTDGEILRAFTCGVKKDGSAIFPLMPWPYYSKMDREDAYDIIAYIRSLAPQEKSYEKRKLDFPLNFIVNTMPAKATFGKRPAESDTVKYGEYLVQNAACRECHTQNDKGTPLPGMDLAGGMEFKLPGITVRTANITPDKTDGIGQWTKEQFVQAFKKYKAKDYKPQAVAPGEFQTVMPWTMYAGMKVSDLEAIYTYLKTIKPVKNQVVKFDKRAEAE
ncbi:c-type cytochrome [Mucilaginibacter sp. HMF5004]|uniref:c-type cytochrome n=1 Tax=Mucilaginibacter rivuli TaxID=2857527 RepID=UPI001C5E2FA8|nr:c-type cytochrome [Mucilaginibacter rivuli]MBW4888675.1 c-type cytochrome [Mucilaginibacter rivuli]